MLRLCVYALLSVFLFVQTTGITILTEGSTYAQLHTKSDPKSWGALLEDNVHATEVDGISFRQVNYTGFAGDKKAFDAIIESIATANVFSLNKNQTYAFFLNAYNALVVRTVIRQPCRRTLLSCKPIKSIQDVGAGLLKKGDVFNQYAGIVGGRKFSLEQIERFLRNPAPKFHEDPRLHACINSASISSPDMRTEAYDPTQIDAQMDAQMSSWMANPTKGFKLDKKAGKVTLSKIFDWFKSDFASHGGALKFVMPYLPKDAQQWIGDFTRNNTLRVDFFEYDWGLNGQAPCDCNIQVADIQVAGQGPTVAADSPTTPASPVRSSPK